MAALGAVTRVCREFRFDAPYVRKRALCVSGGVHHGRNVRFDLPGFWIESSRGMVMRPCPKSGPRGPRAAGEDPYHFTIKAARRIVADNPNATDHQIGRLNHARAERYARDLGSRQG